MFKMNILKALKESGLTFDIAFTSVLKRAIKTLFYVQEELDLHWIPVIRTMRLNERNYGCLQGLNKSETAAEHGEEQVKVREAAALNYKTIYIFLSVFKHCKHLESCEDLATSLRHSTTTNERR